MKYDLVRKKKRERVIDVQKKPRWLGCFGVVEKQKTTCFFFEAFSFFGTHVVGVTCRVFPTRMTSPEESRARVIEIVEMVSMVLLLGSGRTVSYSAASGQQRKQEILNPVHTQSDADVCFHLEVLRSPIPRSSRAVNLPDRTAFHLTHHHHLI